jgi:hypothetical protein
VSSDLKPEYPEFGVEPVISERISAGSSGAPIEVSRKGKAPPLERGRGKAFPACEPDRVTAEGILSEGIMGSTYRILSIEGNSTDLPKTIDISEETPDLKILWSSH